MDTFKPPTRRQVDGPSNRPRQVQPRAVASEVSLASATPKPVFQYQQKVKRPLTGWRKRALLVLAGLVGALILFFGIKILLATSKIISRNNDGSAPALAGNIDPTKLKGEGDGRINILLLGIGGAGHDGAYLSDTMMVVSIDPRTKDVAMLSIPRDLYVPIPGYGSTKINAADAYGEQNGYPGGGGALAKATVSKLLDIPIHYYIRTDFGAFKQAVDSVGGVDINVEKTLSDPYYPNDKTGGYSPLYIKAGQTHMNGDLALRYSRSRETTSDFDRAARQQKVLVALRQKALTLQTLTNPAKISGLIDSVGNHVKTDLQLNEIKKLATIVQGLDESKLTSKVLDTSPDGLLVDDHIDGSGYVEVPKAGIGNFEAIREFAHTFFVDNYLKDENASLSVQNGTTKNGFAKQVGDMLKGYGYNVTSTTTADNQNYSTTVLIDYTDGKKPYTIRYLETRFHIKARKASPQPGDPEIKLIVGSDYKLPR